MIEKVSAVFGGTTGIGRAVAEVFLRNGYKVAVLSRTDEKVKAAQQYLSETWKQDAKLKNGTASQNAPVLGILCNVSDETDVQKAFKTVEQELGPVQVLINAAGINEDSLHVSTSKASMEKLISTNLLGPMLTCKTAVRSMLSRKSGCIINIGSVVGIHGNAGQATYSATKAGLVGLTKSLAKEVGTRGIRVNAIAPGFIETSLTSSLKNRPLLENLTPLRRFGQASEVAEAALMLAEATYVTGLILYVDGGLHLNI